jgi:hypothetical protein
VVGLTWDPFWRSPLTITNILCGWANLRSLLAILFNQNHYLYGWANLRSHMTIPFNQNQSLCVKSDLILMGDLSRWKMWSVVSL